jgi:ribosomal protein S18 acetylase RimI-like enzyme
VTVRPLTHDDLPALADFLARDEERLTGNPSRIGAADVREWTSLADLEHDSWLAEDESGIAAAAWMYAAGDLGVGIVAVGLRAQETGIGNEFVALTEARARAHGAARMHQFALGPDTYARDLLTSLGYEDVRHFYEMAIELTERPELADVEIESVRPEDAEAFHAALDAAFQDHWEPHSHPFAEWYERHSSNPNFDLSLWYLIRSDGEIAAVARNEANRNGGGYVGALGVRREFRGRGYAKALLYRTFAEFWDRGLPRVTLGVDATNPTGATHLYESVGMHVESENIVYEKALA